MGGKPLVIIAFSVAYPVAVQGKAEARRNTQVHPGLPFVIRIRREYAQLSDPQVRPAGEADCDHFVAVDDPGYYHCFARLPQAINDGVGIHLVSRGYVTEYRIGLPDVRLQADVNGLVEFNSPFSCHCAAILFQALPQERFLLSNNLFSSYNVCNQAVLKSLLRQLAGDLKFIFNFLEKTVQYSTFSVVQLNQPFGRYKVYFMVTIRLARAGAKKRPFYHIVATDSRNPRDGRYIERLGYFNPIATGQEQRLSLEQERIDYWLSQGAQPSERVAGLIKTNAGNKAKPD